LSGSRFWNCRQPRRLSPKNVPLMDRRASGCRQVTAE
jgi:hypothetical protein